MWAAGDRIVFPWEGDGWTHLYSVAASGGGAVPLTPGEGEVEHVSLSPDRREVFYSSNQGDLDRRHIWKVAASGGKPVRVTAGDGIEWSPAGDRRGWRPGAPAVRRASPGAGCDSRERCDGGCARRGAPRPISRSRRWSPPSP